MDNSINKLVFLNANNFYEDLRFVPLIYEDVLKDRYLINPNGDIFSILKNKIMQQDTNWGGYKRVCLITERGPRNFSVHRIVASMFIINPYPDIFTDVNHIDGNKSRNIYLNLEWCTNNQNKHHASKYGLYEHGEDRYNSVYTDDFAREICEKFENGESYTSVYNYYQTLYPNSRSTIGSFVYKIYHRKTRKSITDNYKY